jgi:hypothetical protein
MSVVAERTSRPIAETPSNNVVAMKEVNDCAMAMPKRIERTKKPTP